MLRGTKIVRVEIIKNKSNRKGLPDVRLVMAQRTLENKIICVAPPYYNHSGELAVRSDMGDGENPQGGHLALRGRKFVSQR